MCQVLAFLGFDGWFVFLLANDSDDLREIWAVTGEHSLHLIVVGIKGLQAICDGSNRMLCLPTRALAMASGLGASVPMIRWDFG